MRRVKRRVTGVVVHGNGRGSGLGYPTANLETLDHLPEAGIYAAWVRVGHGPNGGEPSAVWHEATVSVGDNPTFGDVDVARAECFLHDFNGDLYGASLEVRFMAYIRDMETFSGLDQLIATAAEDVARARSILGQLSWAEG